MARDGIAPAWLGHVAPQRRTPVRATLQVAAAIALLTFVAPILSLAQVTGYVTLAVFAAVNLALIALSRRADWRGRRSLGLWGALGLLLCAGLIVYEIIRLAAGL
jgi:amino acid transporter